MNLGRFIPNKVSSVNKLALSSTAIKFACLTIVVGIFTLLVAFSVLTGFKTYIRQIVYQFNGHYEVSKIGSADPIRLDSGVYKTYPSVFPEIEKIRAVSYLGGIVQYNQTVEGVVFKAYDSIGIADMNLHLIAGKAAHMNDERRVLISESFSRKMGLKLEDSFIANFFDGNIKYRKLIVSGIFKTNLSDFDEKMIVAPIALINQIYGWDTLKAARLEVVLKPGVNPDEFYDFFRIGIGYDLDVMASKDKFMHLFAWLLNLDQNVMVLIVILFVLVLFSIISTMYILVFERNQMVGVLKTLGATDRQILSVFRVIGLKIGGIGLLLGNTLALGFMYGQAQFKWLKLDPEHYYLDYVPIQIDWMQIISINVFSILVIVTMLAIPYFVIVKMKPIENLKFA